jgi:hypothetical protein
MKCCLYCWSIHEVWFLLLSHSLGALYIVGTFIKCCLYCWSIHEVLSLLLEHSQSVGFFSWSILEAFLKLFAL